MGIRGEGGRFRLGAIGIAFGLNFRFWVLGAGLWASGLRFAFFSFLFLFLNFGFQLMGWAQFV